MVWALGTSRVPHRTMAALIGLTMLAVFAPSVATAKSQAGIAEVAYYDPLAMTPQAKLAAQSSGRGLLSNTFSSIEAYPDKVLPVQPRRLANIDQRDFVKIGAPYRQSGVWYVPAIEPNYDETGVASWYGDDFHGKETSNGEAFDMNAISAAHPTLPLPCIVEVTNMENGRTLKVRVNDRGPFLKGRLIDLSRRGAQELGYYGKGSAKVRVRYVGPADIDQSANDFAAKPYKPGGLQTISYRPATRGPKKVVAPFVAPIAPKSASATPVVAKPVAQNAAAEKPVSASKPVIAKPVSKSYLIGQGRYLQIGAFSSVENAHKLRGKLGVAPVEVRPMNSGAMYRVVLGPFADQMAMDQAVATANDLGISNARVVSLN